MARISLVEQYDNKDVIQQIYMLKTATDGWEERISASEQTANNALTTAEGFDARIDAVEDSNTELNDKVDTFDTRIATAQTTADTAIGNVDTLDRQVTSRIADQEVTALDVASAGTGAYAVTAHKQNGNITSNSFNVSKVTSATIGAGEAQNSIYLQLNLSDGTTVRTNDTVISITGVEEDIHVTSIVLEDAPDAHTIKAIFTYNNGQSISSNTLTYDYPDIASSSSPGLVMGNDAAGGVQVDGQGRMSVVGWDSLVSKAEVEDGYVTKATYNESVTASNADRQRIDEKVDTLSGRVDTIDGDYVRQATFNNSVAAERTYTSEMLNELKTNLEGSIDAVDARCDDISSTVADHGTMLDAQAEAIAGKQDKLTIDTEISASSENPVQNKVISAALDMKASTATTDALTQELADKQDKLTFDYTPVEYSTKPVTSGGIYNRLTTVADVVKSHVGVAITPTSSTSQGETTWTVTCETTVDARMTTGELTVMDLFLTCYAEPTELSIDINNRGTTADFTFKAYFAEDPGTFNMNAYMVAMNSDEFNSAEVYVGTGFMGLAGEVYHPRRMSYLGSSGYAGWKYTPHSTDSSGIVVDSSISASSTNPVQNKVIYTALADKQDTLTAGANIDIADGTISASRYTRSVRLGSAQVFVSEDATYSGFTHKMVLQVPTGNAVVTQSSVVQLMFPPDLAITGRYSTFVETGDQTITFWSKDATEPYEVTVVVF